MKKVYLFQPNLNSDKFYDELLLLLGRFTIVMQKVEFDFLQDDLKKHFKEIEVADPVSQSQGQTSTELGSGQTA